MTRLFPGGVLVMLLLTIGALGCEESPSSPSSDAIVTFRVVNERFRVRLTTSDQVAAARASQSGGPANIPVGRIVAGMQVNTGWSWHLEDVSFAEVAIEVCDGLPSDVEREGTGFASGTYCPWAARVEAIEDN